MNAGLWSFGAYGLSQFIRFGSNLVMSRLLAPDMFGVMAIASTVLVAFAMIFDVGLRPNLVQSKRGSEAVFLNTAWIIQILHGAVICLGTMFVGVILFILNRAKFIPSGTVYADPILVNVIVVISITGLINGARSTKVYEAYRSLLFKRITQIEIVSQVGSIFVMIAWAWLDRSIWAIVAGAVTSNAIYSILSHIWLSGTANRWHWDRTAFSEIFHFGKWVLLSSSLGFLVGNGDRLILGSLATPTVLGAYSIALVIFAVVDQLATRLIADISLPALSEVARHRPADLKATYYRLHSVIGSFSCGCGGILIVSGASLIAFLYDPRYRDAGWILQILAFALIATPFQLGAQLFMVYGAPRLYSVVTALRLSGLIILMTLGFAWSGLTGAIWGVMLSFWTGVPLIVYYIIRKSVFDWRRELLLLPILGLGMLVGEGVNALIAHHFYFN